MVVDLAIHQGLQNVRSIVELQLDFAIGCAELRLHQVGRRFDQLEDSSQDLDSHFQQIRRHRIVVDDLDKD